MSQPFDLSQFPDLPPEVAKAFAAMQFELSVERAARQHEQAVVAEKDAFITELKALIERLEGQVQDYRRYPGSGQSPRSWTRRSWNWRWKIWKPP